MFVSIDINMVLTQIYKTYVYKYKSYHDRPYDNVSHTELDALNIEATFAGSSYGDPGNKLVLVSDTTEESFYAVGEWSEYVSVFFNQEVKVKGLADMALKRYVNISVIVLDSVHTYVCGTTAYKLKKIG